MRNSGSKTYVSILLNELYNDYNRTNRTKKINPKTPMPQPITQNPSQQNNKTVKDCLYQLNEKDNQLNQIKSQLNDN